MRDLGAELDPRKTLSSYYSCLRIIVQRCFMLITHLRSRLSSLQFLVDFSSFTERKHWYRTARLASRCEERRTSGGIQLIISFSVTLIDAFSAVLYFACV